MWMCAPMFDCISSSAQKPPTITVANAAARADVDRDRTALARARRWLIAEQVMQRELVRVELPHKPRLNQLVPYPSGHSQDWPLS